MPIRIVRSHDLVRTAWKNGGGTTAEVAVHPPGADLDTFDWRLSMADVASDGPFSPFPGIDRTLTLIEGRGLDLVIDGTVRRLAIDTPIISFAGESATTGRLVEGPVRDLNVMTRRQRWRHEVCVARSGTTVGVAALLALAGPTRLDVGGRVVMLDRFDTLLCDESGLGLAADHPVLLITMLPAQGLSAAPTYSGRSITFESK